MRARASTSSLSLAARISHARARQLTPQRCISQVLKRGGTPLEQKYAAAIYPVRTRALRLTDLQLSPRLDLVAHDMVPMDPFDHVHLRNCQLKFTLPVDPRHRDQIFPTFPARLQVLKNHHFLLCTLVVWNAFSMEALPIFLDRLADPFTAVLVSVTVVLFFGAVSKLRSAHVDMLCNERPFALAEGQRRGHWCAVHAGAGRLTWPRMQALTRAAAT